MFKDTMTPSERLMSLYQTGWADRPGAGAFAMGFVPKQHRGMTIGECYKDPVIFAKAFLPVQMLYGFDTGPLFGHACAGAAEYGGELSYPGANSRAQSPIIVRHPITTPDAVDHMEVPDPATAGEIEAWCRGARYVMENYPEGYKNPTVQAGDSFSNAGNVIGVETMLIWMLKQPDLVHKVLDNVSQFLIDEVEYVLSTVGPVMFFDGGPTDSNDLISAQQFEQFALPSLIKVRKGALKLGAPAGFLCHPCGNQSNNAKLWAQVPASFGINFDYRTPLPKIIDIFGKSTMVVGNIEPAKFMINSYDEIYKTTMDHLKLAATKCQHGYVVGPGCELPVTTPPANLFAMVSAARDYAQTKEWQERKPK
jgi:uroporphyrinogen decarboxylase